MTADETLMGAGVRGTVLDPMGNPLSQIKVSAHMGDKVVNAWTGPEGDFSLSLPNPGSYEVLVGDDQSSALPLTLLEHDLAIIEWQELAEEPQSSLPLAEIRTVEIVYGEDLVFNAQSPWPQARYRWTVSGGSLDGAGEHVVWDPPNSPGRYLLQVVADWGHTGLAVDSVVLVVDDNGNSHFI